MAVGQQILDTVFGSPQRTKQIPLYSPEQMQTRQDIRQSAQQQLQNTPLSFAPQREQYQKYFNETIIPTLAERFSGNLSSSAFKGALGNTTSDFGDKLAALESNYNLGANKQALAQLKSGLTPEFQNLTTGRTGGLLDYAGKKLIDVGANYLGGGFNNILGGRSFHGMQPESEEEQDPVSQLEQLFSSLNIPPSKIQQILNILGAA